MGQHRPLAHPRRSSGVDQGCKFVPPCFVLDRHIRIFSDEIHELIHTRLRLHLPEHGFFHIGKELLLREGEIIADMAGDDRANLRLRLELERPGQEQVERYQHCGVRIVELVCQFALGIERIVHRSHGPEAIDGVIGDDHLRNVGKEHRHLVAFLHPEIGKRPRKAVDEPFILPIGDFFPHIDKGHAIRIFCGDLAEPFRHGDLFRLELRGHARCIRFMPQTFQGHRFLLLLLSYV